MDENFQIKQIVLWGLIQFFYFLFEFEVLFVEKVLLTFWFADEALSDHCFRCVCVSVCLSVCLSVIVEQSSAVVDPVLIKLYYEFDISA